MVYVMSGPLDIVVLDDGEERVIYGEVKHSKECPRRIMPGLHLRSKIYIQPEDGLLV